MLFDRDTEYFDFRRDSHYSTVVNEAKVESLFSRFLVFVFVFSWSFVSLNSLVCIIVGALIV